MGGIPMRTVKQVSELTGISIRMLHYYDQIGLLKPSKVTEAGYRLYDETALMMLQQILFYKELGIPLKEVKEILSSPHYDRMQALEKQKKLLQLKSNRLQELVQLINKTLMGEENMSFKEFDMREYYQALEELKSEQKDKILKSFGTLDHYDEFLEKCKAKESEIAAMAVKQYGSIEKYVKAMKANFSSEIFTLEEQYDAFKKDCLEEKHPELKKLFRELVSDGSKDPASMEVQEIAEKIKKIAQRDYEIFKTDQENSHWLTMIQLYLVYPEWIQKIDKLYGEGSSNFIGKALKMNFGEQEPKISKLYRELTSDLIKDPSSKEIQSIVCEIVRETEKKHEALKIDAGENYFGYTAELYLTNEIFISATDKKYGEGASKFIGEALKVYAEG